MRLSLLAALLGSTSFAARPSDYLPPAPPWHGASEALIAKPDNPWITPAEKMQLLDSPNYDDTIAWLRKLADASPLLELHPFGQTAQGRTLYVVVATKEKDFAPAALLAGGKPTLLAQGGIHSGEIDGKDAGMMLLRDIAFGGKDQLLDKANFLFVPVFNADGHERASEWNRPNQRGPVHQGWRTTAQNLNLNRDYVKADSPEMQAMLWLLNLTRPTLYLDLHVTDGIDYAYDITYGYHGWNGSFAWSPRIAAWLDHTLRPAFDSALSANGHIPGPLVFAVNNRDLAAGLSNYHGDPRFSNAYGDLRHLPAILVENHSLKPYPQRVLGTYVLLEAALKLLGAHGPELQQAIAADSAARPATVPMNWGDIPGDATKTDFRGIAYDEYVSPASGVKEVRWLGTPRLYPGLPVFDDKPGVVLPRPKAYWVPATKPEVINRLKLHGVQMEPLTAAKTVGVELYRLVNPKAATEPFEGHYTLTTGVKAEPHSEFFPAGSVRVSTDQPLGELAVIMLEPQSKDSLFAWGFFNEILQRTEYIEGYVVAPLAEKMLADDPQLKVEFAAKLVADPKFAADPTARLQWFYERSKFYDERYLLYPVGIER
ncbi:MAG TPA: M14 family metallopeptidase [Lacunisphaera sp.]|nr:M14 family metallopeptidase [Lacunisphaera sp.]